MNRIILLFIVFPSIFYSQSNNSKWEIELRGIPFYQLSSKYSANNFISKTSYFEVFQSNEINQEFSVFINRDIKIGKLGIGLSYNNFNYKFSSNNISYDQTSSSGALSVFRENEIKIQSLGFSVLYEYPLFFGTSVGLKTSILGTIKNEISREPLERLITPEFNYTERFFYNGRARISIMPEIYFKTKLSSNLSLIYGYKLKFWGDNSNPIYTINYAENEHPIIGFSKTLTNKPLFCKTVIETSANKPVAKSFFMDSLTLNEL